MIQEVEIIELPMIPLSWWSDNSRGLITKIWRNSHFKGNTAQNLCWRCADRFFVRLYRNSAGILTYVKGFLCKMTENMQADSVQSRQAGFVRCCLKPCQKMPLKIKFIKDDDERILPYCEEEDAEKFYFQQILTARFSWGSNKNDGDIMSCVYCSKCGI